MREMTVGALLVCGIVALACAGAGSATTASDPAEDLSGALTVDPAEPVWVLPWAVVSARHPWPVTDNLATSTVDDDPFTGFDAQAGDVLAYLTPTVKQVVSVRLLARTEQPVQLRLLSRSARGAETLTSSAWVTVKPGSSRLNETPLNHEGPVVGFELRMAGKASVQEVRLMAKDGFAPTVSGPWTVYDVPRTSDAVPEYADLQRVRFGTFDPIACQADKLGGGPQERLTQATCAPEGNGVRITGQFPPFGSIDEVVFYTEIGPCMALVDGFVLSKRGCRKRP
ncbi:MAG: hypothetical protein ACI9MC_002576 [Kiritimatiellia bacterium]|jgi:hypothetical protein